MTGAGAVFVVYGQEDAGTIELGALAAEDGYRIDGLRNGDRFGRQVGSLGDFDGNGKRDWYAGGDFAQRPLPPGTPRTQAGEVMVALMPTIATTTSLETSATPVFEGEAVTLTATVETTAFDAPAGTGEVEFSSGGSPIAGCEAVEVAADGTASCETSFGTAGSYQLTAAYTDDAGYAASASSDVPQQVNDRPGPGVERAADPIEMQGREATVASVDCPANGGECAVSGQVESFQIADRSYNAKLVMPGSVAEGGTADVILRIGKGGRKALRRAGRATVSYAVGAESIGGSHGESWTDVKVRPAR